MNTHIKNCRFLSGNLLKIIAAVTMLLDHIGVILYPRILWLRIVGRLAFPLYAFFIAEGCRYTKNKAKYFSLLSGLAILCQVVAEIAVPDNDLMSVLMTFSFSVLLIYAMQYAKECLFKKEKTYKTALAFLLFFGGIALTYYIMQHTEFDYGFWGCMLPVFAAAFDFHRVHAPTVLEKMGVLPLRIVSMAIPLLILCFNAPLGDIQFYSFIALLLLLLYGGKRGKWNMKYFFYLFYPLHLAILYGISMLV